MHPGWTTSTCRQWFWPTKVNEVSDARELSLYPNPVVNYAILKLSLDQSGPVSIRLFDARGSLIEIISDGAGLKQGQQTIYFSTRKMPQGLVHLCKSLQVEK
jgi:hypothetical protein